MTRPKAAPVAALAGALALALCAGCNRMPVTASELAGAERMVIADAREPGRKVSIEDRGAIVETARRLCPTPQPMAGEPVLYTVDFISPRGKVWKACVTGRGWFFAADGIERRDAMGLRDYVRALSESQR